MAAPPKITTPAQVLKFRLLHELGTGKTIGTGFFTLFTGGRPSVTDCEALATDVATAWNANLAGLFNNNGILIGVSCQDIYDTTGNVALVTVSHAGTRAGAQPTTDSAIVLNFKISQSYRGGKPKAFLPFGINSDLTDSNTWTGAFVTAVQTDYAAFIAAVVGSSSGTTVVAAQQAVSFYKGKQNNTDASPWAPRNMPMPRSQSVQYPVIGYAAQPRVASQRRRRS